MRWVLPLFLTLFLAVLLTPTTQVLAQTELPPAVGGRVGPTFATFGGDADPDLKTGFVVSGFLGYAFNEMISVYPELSFATKGATDSLGFQFGFTPEGDFLETTLGLTVNLDYLELQLPIALMVPNRSSAVRARLYAGPSVALELSCSAETKVKAETFSSSTGASLGVESSSASAGCGEETDDPFLGFVPTKSIDFGLVFGVGIDVGIGNGSLMGDFRYGLGLTDINDGVGGSIKNRTLSILVGYAHYLSH